MQARNTHDCNDPRSYGVHHVDGICHFSAPDRLSSVACPSWNSISKTTGPVEKVCFELARVQLGFSCEKEFLGVVVPSAAFLFAEVARQGVYTFKAKTKMSIDLESYVAADHFLRRVDRVLDLSFVRDLTAPRYAVQQGRSTRHSNEWSTNHLLIWFHSEKPAESTIGPAWL